MSNIFMKIGFANSIEDAKKRLAGMGGCTPCREASFAGIEFLIGPGEVVRLTWEELKEVSNGN